LSHRAKIERGKKGRELLAAEAFSYILLHYFAILQYFYQRLVAGPPWVGDPSSGRVFGKMSFTDLDYADDAVCNILEEHLKYLRADRSGEAVSSPHLSS